MSARQRYWVRFPETHEVLLEVDPAILTNAIAADINSFWGGAALRLADQDGDPVKTAVRLFGSRAIFHMQADGGAAFEESNKWGAESWTKLVLELEGEGWPGYEELGIRIVSAYVESCDYFDVTLQAEANPQPSTTAGTTV